MDTVKFACKISSNDPTAALNLEIWLDQNLQWSKTNVESDTFECSILDSDQHQEHELRFVLSGKLPEHTGIDSEGNIVRDVLINIGSVQINDINIPDIVISESSVYLHNFNNPDQPVSEQKFFGSMGCNGTLKFVFSTPIYLWLLQHT